MVRLEQAPPLHQVVVVGVVEHIGAPKVKRRHYEVAPDSWTGGLQPSHVLSVYVSVIVDATAEETAARPPDIMGARQGHHLCLRETFGGEHFPETGNRGIQVG